MSKQLQGSVKRIETATRNEIATRIETATRIESTTRIESATRIETDVPLVLVCDDSRPARQAEAVTACCHSTTISSHLATISRRSATTNSRSVTTNSRSSTRSQPTATRQLPAAARPAFNGERVGWAGIGIGSTTGATCTGVPVGAADCGTGRTSLQGFRLRLGHHTSPAGGN